MFEGPRGQFGSKTLRPMLESTPGVLRKRVTILYRPIPAGEASEVVESDINNANFSGSTKRRPSAREQQRLAYAKKAAAEEEQGAGLVRFGIVITATCAATTEFPRLDKIIPSLSNRARLKIRPARQPGRRLPGGSPARGRAPGAHPDSRPGEGLDLMSLLKKDKPAVTDTDSP
jgi:hypothetical protein